MQFLDRARILVRAGDGGNGVTAFRREKFVPRGGPSGGDGGRGGHVDMEATDGLNTLLHFRFNPRYVAERGRHGEGKNCHGRDGEDLLILVPVGTLVSNLDTGEVIHDFTYNGERVRIAEGGRGGRGNSAFATSTNRAPRRHDDGRPGVELNLQLELKLIADVGLVGLPNAGKSTLISRISAARPKIADYPFTTVAPNLGVVAWREYRTFVVADIPGLIEGAAEGRGLGHQFLRHIERARVLCLLLDLANIEGVSPGAQERVLLDELEQYEPALLDRPRLVVGSKSDSAMFPWDGELLSAVTGQGVRELVGRMAALVHEARQEQPVHEGVVIIRPEVDGARVERLGDHEFRLHGRQVERAVALNDVTTPEALSYIDHQLGRLGVPRMLARAGATDGDVIWIGGFSFEYQQEI